MADELLDEALPPPSRRRRLLMVVFWPAFLMAGVLESLVFAWLNPADLLLAGGAHLALSNMAIYTLAFLIFWVVIACASGLAVLLVTSPPVEDGPGA